MAGLVPAIPARLERLMVRSVAQRRISNHGPLAPLSPAAHPSRRPLPRAPQDEAERVGIAELTVPLPGSPGMTE
jgi:hypothetical protein